ncbi:MAG: PUR family DNA/RNA-binding protein, partial [SAR324 cluster bacterium]|nr:PUR family DNA/RNA-binding protein [SAR324 cluster bacterium]
MINQDNSQTIKAGSITYFFDVKETRQGKPYLV